jgi:hypothetical protein
MNANKRQKRRPNQVRVLTFIYRFIHITVHQWERSDLATKWERRLRAAKDAKHLNARQNPNFTFVKFGAYERTRTSQDLR